MRGRRLKRCRRQSVQEREVGGGFRPGDESATFTSARTGNVRGGREPIEILRAQRTCLVAQFELYEERLAQSIRPIKFEGQCLSVRIDIYGGFSHQLLRQVEIVKRRRHFQSAEWLIE